ncbi:MAG: MacB family efflux pump subunit [Arcobacteraceae bacterium]
MSLESLKKPLILLKNIIKNYQNGDLSLNVLNGVSLEIFQGEFVAIVGASGSGKSTLMNILGCLDKPSSGEYLFNGKNVANLSKDELAHLRREAFGFVFQSYNLITSLNASENVEVPSMYAGMTQEKRKERAKELLTYLNLSDKLENLPSQLSGGQQQRVSIARALMNGGAIILADEPTGALDSKSGQEVIGLFNELSEQGHTIILITHDMHVASHAHRMIEIHDGKIINNSQANNNKKEVDFAFSHTSDTPRITEIIEATKSAVKSLKMNIFRTVLTLLGIVIGVASVIAMLAIGDGAKKEVLERISSMGTNLLVIRPGIPNKRGFQNITTLVFDDVEAIESLENIVAAIPESRKSVTVQYGNIDQTTSLNATSSSYTKVRQWETQSGTFFNDEDNFNLAKVVVLGQTVAQSLFGENDAVGKFILIDNIMFQVIGVMAKKGANAFGEDEDDVIFTPYYTGSLTIIGQKFLRNITVAMNDLALIEQTENDIKTLLIQRHGLEDFRILNMASLIEETTKTQNTLTVLLGSIAAISLLVGGIGVMNIMLVNVTERTKEIGIRMATGARTRNILQQFLIEALVVSALGGVIGILVGLGVTFIISSFGTVVEYSVLPIILAFSCAFLTGLIFGYLPAKKAANLDPVDALASK